MAVLVAVLHVGQAQIVPDSYQQQRQAGMDSIKNARISWEEQYWQKRKLYDAEQRDRRLKPSELPAVDDTSRASSPVEHEILPTHVEKAKVFSDTLEVGYMEKVRQVDVRFYGHTITFDIPAKAAFDNQESQYLASQLATYKKRLNLNDWGLLLLAQKLASAIEPNITNEQSALTVKLMNTLHYDLRLGRTGRHLHTMVHTNYQLYNTPYMEADGKHYYAIGLESVQNGTIYSYDKKPADAVNPIDMRLRKSPLVGGDRDLIDFFADYPLTHIYVPATAAVSDKLASQMEHFNFANKKDTIACLNQLLAYVQSFEYKSDLEQFGHEKYFFCEEMYYYPGSDCEDRAILFSQMVRRLFGLDVVLLDYPNHVTTAVRLPTESTTGHYITLQEGRYYLCDPTFRGAKVGQLDNRFHGQKAKAIRL